MGKVNDGLFSSKTEMWETPLNVFNKYNDIHKFTTDVCAIESNKKCNHFYSPEENGLIQEWEGVCWMNPPYGSEIIKWVKKAHDSVMFGKCDKVVALLPARTDTRWFHSYCYHIANIELLKGRIKFVGGKSSAPFPSMIVIWSK